MGRAASLSPLGLYNWDSSVFDQLVIPEPLDRETLINNLLLETAELEVIYPDPHTFKFAVGMWSRKELPIWNHLYETTQYEYDPIENYNRYESGEDSSGGSTVHSGTDSTSETEIHGGEDERTHDITHSGKDTTEIERAEGGTQTLEHDSDTTDGGTERVEVDNREGGTQQLQMARAQGGTETEAGTSSITNGGSDYTLGSTTGGHWVAGFDTFSAAPSDGLAKQSRDEGDNTVSTQYGKTEAGTSSKTTTFGKTETNSDTTTFGKTEDNDSVTTFGKTVNVDETDTTRFGKTENDTEELTYGKREKHEETTEYGETVSRNGSTVHGEKVETDHAAEHTLHAHGNIGTVTTQQMIVEERDIASFNIYDHIIESFKMRFCILVY